MKTRNVFRSQGAMLTLCALLGSGAALACDNHGFGGFGYHGMGNHSPRFNGPTETGMALEAQTNYTVTLGQPQSVPFTVIVPASYDNASVQWKSGEVLGLSGDVKLDIASGSGKQFALEVNPSKVGQYVVRGKLSGEFKGQPSSKSAFILIKVVEPELANSAG